MIFAIFAAFTAFLLLAVITSKAEGNEAIEKEEQIDPMTTIDIERVKYLGDYTRHIDSLLNLGEITREEHEAEAEWISEQLSEIESRYLGESHEISEEMTQTVDDFFESMDEVTKGERHV